MCVLVLAVGACSLLEQSSVCTWPVVTVAPGSGHCHPTLSLLLASPGALGSAHLLPGTCPILLAGSQWGFQRGFSTSAAGSQEMCARNVVGFMFPVLPILF